MSIRSVDSQGPEPMDHVPEDGGIRNIPRTDPKKDFKKVLGQKERRDQTTSEDAIEDEDEIRPLSPFDLVKPKPPASKSPTPPMPEPTPEPTPETAHETAPQPKLPHPLTKEMGVKDQEEIFSQGDSEATASQMKEAGKNAQIIQQDTAKRAQAFDKAREGRDAALLETDATVMSGSKEKTKETNGRGATFSQEKTDLTALQPAIATAQFSSGETKMGDSPAATIRDLINQLVEKIQVLHDKAQTSTIVTLSHPPLLAGSTITLSSMDADKKQISLSFAGLSDAGKAFLDAKLAEGTLHEALEKRGVLLQGLVTTTAQQSQPLIAMQADEAQQQQGQRDEQRQQQQQQQRRKFNWDEDMT